MDKDRTTKKAVHNPPCDILSSLPENALESILTCLPLRDAARTSILSKNWRNKWLNIPKLVFDDIFLPDLQQNLCDRCRIMMIVYQVLLRHQGPILKFTLYVPRFEEYSGIDQLFPCLSKNGVQEFTLSTESTFDNYGIEYYKLPSSFYSCVQLRHLNLTRCLFKPPPGFIGFSRLTSLRFRSVEFDTNIATFVSNCPLLESLILVRCLGCENLEFDAPKLKFLSICSSFSSIYFKNTPFLATLFLNRDESDDIEEGEAVTMIEVFGCLPSIKELHLGHKILKLLAIGGVPEKFPFNLTQLKAFEINDAISGFADMISVTLCVIKSSPNLEKLFITDYNRGGFDDEKSVIELMELLYHSNISSNRIREVKMPWWPEDQELEFIKLILAKSPVLERMILVPSGRVSSDERIRILEVLHRFKRASPEAEIIISNWYGV